MDAIQSKTEFKKIYSQLLPDINKIYNIYSFLPSIILKTLEKETKNILLEIYNRNNNEKKDISFYLYMYKSYMETYIKKIIQTPEYSKQIINNYINQFMVPTNNNQENINQLNQFDSFLERYEFILTPDNCIELINSNEVLVEIINQIVNKKYQVHSNIIDINENIIMLIDVYCKMKNVTNELTEQIEDNPTLELDMYLPDSVRLYLSEIPSKILTTEEERNLAIKKDEGNASAREKLIEHNLKFVVTIAKRYVGRGLDILELIQEGNVGLITAVDRFDYKKGFKLVSYAEWWIKQSICKALCDKSRTIRLSSKKQQKIQKYAKTRENLTGRLNREPTTKEIAEELNMSISQVEKIQTSEFIIISLNEKITEEDDADELEYFLLPSDEKSLESSYIRKELYKEIIELMSQCQIKEREIKILLLRNGFYGEPKTQEEVGKIFGVSRERIRQIENKVLSKLRLSAYTRELIEHTSSPKEARENLEAYKKYYKTLYGSNSRSMQRPEAINEMKEIVAYIEFIEEKITEERQPTIFDIFKQYGYTEKQIESVVYKLSDIDRKRIALQNNIGKILPSKETEQYLNITLPRIRQLLKSEYPFIENNEGKKVETIKVEYHILDDQDDEKTLPNIGNREILNELITHTHKKHSRKLVNKQK